MALTFVQVRVSFRPWKSAFKRRHLIVKRRENLTESERGDLTQMLEYLPALAPLRQSSPTAFDVGLDSAIVALSGRMRLREGLSRSPESVVTELWYQVFGERELDPAGKAEAPDGAMRRNG